MLDFVKTLEGALGQQATLNMMDTKPGDVRRTSADPALLRALTGYAQKRR